MKVLSKVYSSPFIAEKTKITRLLKVIQDKLSEHTGQVAEHFELRFHDGKTFETGSPDDVFGLDNSARNPIRRLVISCSTTPAGAAHPAHKAEIDFDGLATKTKIAATVLSDSIKWATESLDVIEEQVERTLQSGIMPKLSATLGDIIISWIVGVLFLTATLGVLLAPSTPSKVADTMWLTENDLRELSTTLERKPNLTSQEAAEVLTRQIRNLTAGQKPHSNPIAWLFSWRLLLVLPPLIIISVAFSYLVLKCYPRAVFPWGDCGELYGTLVSRRKTVWQVIIGALLIGMVGNLFVLGVGTFLQR